MPLPPTSSAQRAREALASRLRELRLDAGISGRALAQRCGWSESKSSRIENTKTTPSDADIRAWCEACRAPEQATDLIEANRRADSLYVQWRRVQRTGMRRLQESSVPLYQRTRTFRAYCSNVVPGFLQTTGYATSLLGSITSFRDVPNDAAEAAAARVRRSAVIHEDARRCALLVEETVLRYRIGDRETMAAQLGHLLTAMAFPSVSLGIIPTSAERQNEVWPLETFTVFDNTLVKVELLSAAVNVTERSEIDLYLKAFQGLSELAVYGASARALIVQALETLER
ncbi:Scr1 family TA system antitoxin-like transcriptional regulator [Streptomyces xiamenensis]|uniref:Scr1 family TA system antitoxin-like transcriptional regulator n=1 Tax=Streptomyces xiamenensis TaxID=408015 RepID=UPI0036EC51D6